MRRHHGRRWAVLSSVALLAALGGISLVLQRNGNLTQEASAVSWECAHPESRQRSVGDTEKGASMSPDGKVSDTRSRPLTVVSPDKGRTEQGEGMRKREPIDRESNPEPRKQGRAKHPMNANQTPIQKNQSRESQKAESDSLHTRLLLAAPWGNQVGQLGRDLYPEAPNDVFPADFYLSSDNVLWICDWVNDRVVGYRVDPKGEQPAETVMQVRLKRPTHVVATQQGVFILDWTQRNEPEGSLQCRLFRYADGMLQELASIQDIGVGFPGQIVALDRGGILIMKDRLHRVTLSGQVQEVPIEAGGKSVSISPSGTVYLVEKWERGEGILRGTIKRWTLDPEMAEQPSLEVALSYDTGPDVDPERLSKGYPRGALLIGADGAGRLYFLLHELLKEGKLRLTLFRFSPSGELLARGSFQPAGVDLRKAWARCSDVFWRVTADGRVLVPIPTEQEYRLLEASFGPGS